MPLSHHAEHVIRYALISHSAAEEVIAALNHALSLVPPPEPEPAPVVVPEPAPVVVPVVAPAPVVAPPDPKVQ